ncbi:hypothetical protein [Bradyrhizobium sp. ORS 375]|uniref:hypothetical protein n=1 Tax=Bradyrhizobium sp. (strain ORS 375) TaxID=566679 RepID=UPI001112AE0E|nr:hypothetical protein [Bradyrhizobium sp. ORS 375]
MKQIACSRRRSPGASAIDRVSRPLAKLALDLRQGSVCDHERPVLTLLEETWDMAPDQSIRLCRTAATSQQIAGRNIDRLKQCSHVVVCGHHKTISTVTGEPAV